MARRADFGSGPTVGVISSRWLRTSGGDRWTALTDQFGQGSLERRVDSIADVIPDITTLRPELAAELRTAESDLRRAVYVTGQMPRAKRWRAQRAISAQLDQIEKSLIDAVLSPR